jgi:hypothetical protein
MPQKSSRTQSQRTKALRAGGSLAVAGVLALGLVACGDDAKDAKSKAESAVSSLGSQAKDAVNNATAQAGAAASSAKEAVSQATASAGAAMSSIKDGADAAGDVTVGATATDGDGRTTAPLTVANKTDKEADYSIQVNFRDAGGNLLDSVVVSEKDIKAGATGTATARSNRGLEGEIKAEVARALRH